MNLPRRCAGRTAIVKTSCSEHAVVRDESRRDDLALPYDHPLELGLGTDLRLRPDDHIPGGSEDPNVSAPVLGVPAE
jgi:hypothetical protein